MTHKTDGEPDSFSVAASAGEEGVVPWSFLGSFHDAYLAGGIVAAVLAVGLLARRAEAAEADRVEEAAARDDGRELSGVGLAEA